MTRARDVANLIGSGNYSSTTFTATAGQTVFSIAHTQNFVQVFMNGLLLDLTADYTSNGSAVTLTSGAAAGDEIEVVAYNTFSVGDALNQAAADTRYVNTSGDTMTGNLLLGSNKVGIGTATPAKPLSVVKANGGDFIAEFQNTTSGTPYGVHVKDASSGSNGYPLLQVTNSAGSSTYFRVDSGTGHVTKPSQPMFGAYNYSGTTTAIGGYNPMLWANVHTNVGNHFNNSTGKFTFPVSGKYVVFCNINYKAADSNWSGLYMLYNNSVQMVSWSMNTVATQHDNVIISSLVSASANDTLAFCWHNSYTAPSTNASYNMAYIYLLG